MGATLVNLVEITSAADDTCTGSTEYLMSLITYV